MNELTTKTQRSVQVKQPDMFNAIANAVRPELHPRILSGVNGTPAGVKALAASLERSKS